MPTLIYQDPYLLVANKPAGLLSVPGRGPHKQDCLIARLQQRFGTALCIHRLDCATSGLMVVARDADSHRAMSRLFETRQVQKTYTALVAGQVEQEEGQVNLPLICDWPNRPLQKVDHQQGKNALTEFQRLATYPDRACSRLALTPITGRSHQLRVHMREIGHPILGDEFYAPVHIRALADRLLLHATRLRFQHPMTGEDLDLVCPADF